MTLLKKYFPNIIAFFVFVTIWTLANVYTKNLIPDPYQTFLEIAVFLKTPDVYGHILFTLLNITLSLFAAFIISASIVLLFQFLPSFFKQLTSPLISVVLFLPSIIIIYITIILWGYNTTTIRLIVITIVASQFITLFQNIPSQINQNYFKLSSIFSLSKLTTVKHIIFPQILPLIISATISGFSLATKITVLVEAIIGNRGIGYLISYYFYVFDLKKVIALSIILVFTTLIIPPIAQKIYLKVNPKL